MSQSVDLENIEKRARRSIAEDGLTYIMMGILLLAVSLLMQERIIIIVPLLPLLLIPISEAIRRRITYPRIGYVKFSVPKNFARGLFIFCLIAVIFLLGVIFLADGRFENFVPLAISIVFALAMFFGLSMQGMRFRDWLIIGLILISGILTSLSVPDWRQATAIIMGIAGTVVIIIGFIDLFIFLRKYPAAQAESPEKRNGPA